MQSFKPSFIIQLTHKNAIPLSQGSGVVQEVLKHGWQKSEGQWQAAWQVIGRRAEQFRIWQPQPESKSKRRKTTCSNQRIRSSLSRKDLWIDPKRMDERATKLWHEEHVMALLKRLSLSIRARSATFSSLWQIFSRLSEERPQLSVTIWEKNLFLDYLHFCFWQLR